MLTKVSKRSSLPLQLSRTKLIVPKIQAFCFSIDTIKSRYPLGAHRSNAEQLVNEIPVIEVDGHVAVCDGGSGVLGHPLEYIQLDRVSKAPAVCAYCGLRYKMKPHGHGHH